MTVFSLTIEDHRGHFGTEQHQERAVIARILADVTSALRSGRELAGDQPIVLNGETIGMFSFGAKAHSYVDAAARRR
jgi:hypothetical protein